MPRLRLRALLVLLASFAVVLGLGTAGLPASSAAPSSRQRYVVQTVSVGGTARALSALHRYGISPTVRYRHAITGFAATLTPAQAATLRANPAVVAVTRDQKVYASTTQTDPTWGLDRIDQRSVDRDGSYRYDTTGKGVSTIVMDTGTVAHPDFGDRVAVLGDWVGDRADDDPDYGVDCNGHGTHVMGTVGGTRYGVAKGADLLAFRVLDCNGEGDGSVVIEALDAVAANAKDLKPAVVNLSLGGDVFAPLDNAVQGVIDSGITVVVAAGNDNDDACNYSPAHVTDVITVAATDSHDQRADFSDYGSCVDLFAPGVKVTSDYYQGGTASASGTSMATPHVTGMVARYLQRYPKASPAKVQAALLKGATSNVVGDAMGSPNKLLFGERAPSIPTAVAAQRDDGKATITLRWAAPSTPGTSAVTGYVVTRSGVGVKGKPFADLKLSPTKRSYTFTHLRRGVVYTVAVHAVNAVGPGSQVSKKATLLTSPGKPVISKATAGSTKDTPVTITAHWKKPTSGGKVVRYDVAVRKASGGDYSHHQAGASATGLKIGKLKRNVKYVVKVRAHNAAGWGGWSKLSGSVTAH